MASQHWQQWVVQHSKQDKEPPADWTENWGWLRPPTSLLPLPQEWLSARALLKLDGCLQRGWVRPQTTHVPAPANLKNWPWSSQLPKAPATQVKLAFRDNWPFLAPHAKKWSKKGARNGYLSSPATPECTQHVLPVSDASSCYCSFLPRKLQLKPTHLANDDVFPNSIYTGVCTHFEELLSDTTQQHFITELGMNT